MIDEWLNGRCIAICAIVKLHWGHWCSLQKSFRNVKPIKFYCLTQYGETTLRVRFPARGVTWQPKIKNYKRAILWLGEMKRVVSLDKFNKIELTVQFSLGPNFFHYEPVWKILTKAKIRSSAGIMYHCITAKFHNTRVHYKGVSLRQTDGSNGTCHCNTFMTSIAVINLIQDILNIPMWAMASKWLRLS